MDVMMIEDHVVVCGWNDHAERLLEDLRSADRMTQAIVLSNREDIPRLMDSRVHYVAADATTEKGLRLAKVESSRVVIVLSDTVPGRSSSDADARSVLTALAVERMNPEIHTIVEIVHEENLFHLRNAGVDEVIISGAYTGTMLSQAAQFPGISDVFADLFQIGGGSQLREMPVKSSDKTFGSLVQRLLAVNGGVAIGYRRGEEVNMVPAPNTALEVGDKAIVMSRVEESARR